MPRTRLLPQDEAFRQRIEMTISCHDCDHIPKILEGGKIFEENGQRIQYMFNGLKVIAGGYYGGWMEEIIQRLRGHHEPQEEKVFSELLKLVRPDATMIELGAFWGYYSAWFGKTIPNSINYLIEPDPNRIVIGKTNFALNGLTGTFIEAMIGKESKTSSSFTCESDGSVRNIPTLSVDDLIAANKIKYVEVLHSDIQGAELDMLEGCLKSIHERKIRFILISTHQTPDPLTHFKCIDFLRKHDAHIFAAHSISESYSADGLIAASFLPADRGIPIVSVSKNIAINSVYQDGKLARGLRNKYTIDKQLKPSALLANIPIYISAYIRKAREKRRL